MVSSHQRPNGWISANRWITTGRISALGGALLYGRERVDMPEPGETMAARISSRVADPVDVLLFQPLGRLRKRLTVFADGLQFLTIRRTLSLMFWALVVFLGVVAVLEQL